MSNIDPSILLSKEFEDVSVKLAELREKKQKKTEEFKELYDAFTAEVAEIDKEAAEEWKKLMDGETEVQTLQEEEEVTEEE